MFLGDTNFMTLIRQFLWESYGLNKVIKGVVFKAQKEGTDSYIEATFQGFSERGWNGDNDERIRVWGESRLAWWDA